MRTCLAGSLGKLLAKLPGLLGGPLVFEGCGGCTFLLSCCCLLELLGEVAMSGLSLLLHRLFSGGTREVYGLYTVECSCFFLKLHS